MPNCRLNFSASDSTAIDAPRVMPQPCALGLAGTEKTTVPSCRSTLTRSEATITSGLPSWLRSAREAGDMK